MTTVTALAQAETSATMKVVHNKFWSPQWLAQLTLGRKSYIGFLPFFIFVDKMDQFAGTDRYSLLNELSFEKLECAQKAHGEKQ